MANDQNTTPKRPLYVELAEKDLPRERRVKEKKYTASELRDELRKKKTSGKKD